MRLALRAAACVCLLASIALAGGCGPGKTYQVARKAEKRGEAHLAYENYYRAARKHPGNGAVIGGIKRTQAAATAFWETQAEAAMKDGRHADAWRMWMRALEIQPNHSAAPRMIRQLEREHTDQVADARSDWLRRGSVSLTLASPAARVATGDAVGQAEAAEARTEPSLVVASADSGGPAVHSASIEPARPEPVMRAAADPEPARITAAGQEASAQQTVTAEIAAAAREGAQETDVDRAETGGPVTADGETRARRQGDGAPAEPSMTDREVKSLKLPEPSPDRGPPDKTPPQVAAESSLPKAGVPDQPTEGTEPGPPDVESRPTAAAAREVLDGAVPVQRPAAGAGAETPTLAGKPREPGTRSAGATPPGREAGHPRSPRAAPAETASDAARKARRRVDAAEEPARAAARAGGSSRSRQGPGRHVDSSRRRRMGEFLVVLTLSREDRRYPKETRLIDGITVKLKDTDGDLDADLNLYDGKRRITKIRELPIGRSKTFRSRSGRQYRLTILSVHHKTHTVRLGVEPA